MNEIFLVEFRERCVQRWATFDHGNLDVFPATVAHVHIVILVPRRKFAAIEAQGTASPFLKRKPNTSVVETTAYRDVVEMQKMLLLVYVPLPILLAMLVSEVRCWPCFPNPCKAILDDRRSFQGLPALPCSSGVSYARQAIVLGRLFGTLWKLSSIYEASHHHVLFLPRDPSPRSCPPNRQVLRASREAEAAGGDEYAFLHNMVTSLSLASSVLCMVSAFSVISRSALTMRRATAFQGVVAPGMALCGVLLFGSSVFVAAGEP